MCVCVYIYIYIYIYILEHYKLIESLAAYLMVTNFFKIFPYLSASL